MTCDCLGGFCLTLLPPLVRLRTSDGGYLYLEWHEYLGPTFYRDRQRTRELSVTGLVDEDDPAWAAFDWWHSRGKRG